MTVQIPDPTYDLKNAVSDNRLAGLWRMMTGFHWTFIAATIALAFAALAKTAVYFVFRDFVDDVLGQPAMAQWIPIVALSFIGLALLEGGFTFLTGRWAARTAEGTAYRLRNYLFDQIQRLLPIAHDDARLLMERDGGLAGERGVAARLLLYLFERDWGVQLLRGG